MSPTSGSEPGHPRDGALTPRTLFAIWSVPTLLSMFETVMFSRIAGGRDGKIAKGFFEPSAVDLRRAVAREKLAVDSLFCVQTYPAMSWESFSVTP
jgi:hypothetical protein